ncbi:MAG: hypothetical protein CMN56_15850 [Sneathiella sp.]|uniref:hypothetical protein n=1 Tax=Sneathiella sp. TaxID=1964365 RepID=UPI000C5E45E0|nr:hypothetical protein [Sneathiella sp.]MAZ04608.1 hypothetical protein [Sneathiella sp.]
MGITDSDISEECYRFFWKEISDNDFEGALYRSKNLENLIGNAPYLQLIGFDYSKQIDVNAARHLIAECFNLDDPEKLFKLRVAHLATDMLAHKLDLKSGCIALWNLHSAGHNFIPVKFVGYGSELEDGKPVSFYEDRIRNDLKSLLHELQQRLGGT